MKFSVDQKSLNESTQIIQRAVATKSSIPALEGIYIKAKENTIFIAGYDLEFGITTEIPALVEEQGEAILNARLFCEIVRRLPDESVYIEIDENCTALLRCGNSEFTITGMEADEYPEIPSIFSDDEIVLQQGVLKNMIRQTIFAVAVNDNKPVHKGTLFEISDRSICLVSVDGYRLAMRTEHIDSDSECKFVVPGKTLSEIMKMLGDNENDVKLIIGKRHILFELNGYVVFSRLLEGEFLDYKNTIPKTAATTVEADTEDFIETIERVSLIITERLKSPLKCIFANDKIEALCTTSIGKAHDSLKADISGDEVTIGFNNKYLLDALRACESDKVKIELGGSLSPMKIVPVSGDEFLFLVLPVRLK